MNKNLKTLLAFVTAALLLVTTGCAQLPKSGEIKTGPNVESGLETDYLYYSPSGSSKERSAEQLLL